MINSRPNNSKYNGGNYIPKNRDKVLKLNTEGGVYYRSLSLEKKIMTWLDHNDNIIKWGAECIKVPYQMVHMKDGSPIIKEHTYYPDFYYEINTPNGIKQVVAEAKPQKEYEDTILFERGQFRVDEKLNHKRLKNLEYRFKMAQKNSEKWKAMIKWCNKKGFDFIVITEETLRGV